VVEFLLSGTEGLPRLLYVKTPAPDREPHLARLLARISSARQPSWVGWFVMSWRR
jgi:hypothetical protein